MTKSLSRLKKEIEALKKLADVARRREAAGVISRIKDAIATYGLSASDLGLVGAGKTSAAARRSGVAARRTRRSTKRADTGVIRYRDVTGNSWTGHGRRPQWFLDALASGKKPEDLQA